MIVLMFFLNVFAMAETTTNGQAAPSVDPKKQEMANTLEKLADDFDKANRDLSCKKASDCEALAMGHRACGGPDYYLVISKKNKKASRLRKLSTKHQKLREEYLKTYQKGMMSICSLAGPPEIDCANKRCVDLAAK